MNLEVIEAIEAKRITAQTRLDAARTPTQRNQRGQFATPPPLAKEIVEQVKRLWPDEEDGIRFLDPALGTGAFYAALRQVFPARQIQTAMGVEIDPEVAQIAEDLWRAMGLQVIQAGFTRLPFPPNRQPNLIIANPPYVRHHHLPQETKTHLQHQVKAAVNLRLNGLAGLYCYFLLIALCITKKVMTQLLILSHVLDGPMAQHAQVTGRNFKLPAQLSIAYSFKIFSQDDFFLAAVG